MKNLFLTLILFQTAPLLAMWNKVDEDFMRTHGNGHMPIDVRRDRELEVLLYPHVRDLGPRDPLPLKLGAAKQRVFCTFENDEAEVLLILPTEYDLHGEWLFKEDRDNAQDLATLQLKAHINNRWIEAGKLPAKEIPHKLLAEDKEVSGFLYFDGDSVYRARTKMQTFHNPRTKEVYKRPLSDKNGPVPNHEDGQIIYVEPFAVRDEPLLAQYSYRGTYSLGTLNEHEKLPGRGHGNVFYSDGLNIYLPNITQELWTRDSEEPGKAQVGFFIASYKRNQRISFIPQAKIPKGFLPEGLYQLLYVQEDSDGRIEKWKRLGEDPQTFEIVTPEAGISSIAGMGSYAPRKVASGSANMIILEMQRAIREIQETIKKNAEHYPEINDCIIFVGPSDAGKTTLINAIAGRELEAGFFGRSFMSLDVKNPLPGFKIGQRYESQTQVPTFWYDKGKLLIDCPGFGDSKGEAADIVNAFSINKLFPNKNVKIVLVAEESNITSGNAKEFLKLLNQMTALYEDQSQLYKGLSVVLTRATKSPHIVFRPLSSLLNVNQTILTDPARKLLAFLAHNDRRNRFFAFPAPKNEGDYTFDREGFLKCLGRDDDKRTSQFVYNPLVRISVGAEAKNLIGDLAENLNQHLVNYMATEGAQRIINYCRQKIDLHEDTIATLRAEFARLVVDLQNVSAKTPEAFLNGLNAILNNKVDLNEIDKTIESIGFLKTIKDSVNYHVGEWKNALIDTVNKKIVTLAITPKISFKDDILTLKGTLIGASEINSAVNKYPKAKIIQACGLNRIFIDENMSTPGKSLGLMCPQLRIIDDKTINLDGRPGDDGKDGKDETGEHGDPGQPGRNGGHFIAKVFDIDGLNKLTVGTNGGSGGKGGNGGKGRDGANGIDGDLNLPLRTAPYEYYRTPNGDYHEYTTGTYHYFDPIEGVPNTNQDITTDGQKGQDGGQGGAAGLGGLPGLCVIDGVVKTGKPGEHGIAGEFGIGGQGGKHGRHCTGTVITGLHFWQWWTSGSREGNSASWPLADQGAKKHVEREPECAPNGYTPKADELNSFNQNQPEQQVDHEVLEKNFLNTNEKYFVKASMNSNICPFTEVFPDLCNISLEQKKPQMSFSQKTKKAPKAKATVEVKSTFEVNFNGAVHNFDIIDVPSDGDCGYSALGLSREDAADMLLNNLDNEIVLELIGQEIEDNFIFLEHLLKNFNYYKALVDYQTSIDRRKREKISILNEILIAHGIATKDEDGLLAYSLESQRSREFEIEKDFLQEIVDEEEFLHEEKRAFCLKRETVEFYIENYIRPAACVYRMKYPDQESNWLNFSPDREQGARSSAAALALILGKNLAIWTRDRTLLCSYNCNIPQAETIHLLFVGANHFNRLAFRG